MRYLQILILIFAVVFISGCASTRGFKADSFVSPLPVAVLPVNNMSNDLKSASMFRELFKNSLQDLGYSVAKNCDVDYLLQQNGLTDGGQLTNIPPEKLCSMLGVDAVFIGNLEKASQVTTGVYNKKQVKADMKLYRKSDLLWADTAEASEKDFGLDSKAIGEAFVKRVADKALAKFNGHPLLILTEQMVLDLQKKLPGKRIAPTGWEKR
jgi:hypothetical protein